MKSSNYEQHRKKNSDIQLLASQAGADTFLAKPIDLEELEQVIKRVTLNDN